MTFRSTESERLGIVTDEHRSVAWVDIARAEITLFDTHGGGLLVVVVMMVVVVVDVRLLGGVRV